MKKIVLFLMLLIINISLFAAPDGGRDRPDRGGPSGGREPGGFSREERPKREPSPESPDKKLPGMAKPDPADSLPPQTTNFRGKRIVLSEKEPEILKTEIKEKEGKSIKITLHFNQPVNPASVSGKNIIIDDFALPEETKITFNKKSDSVSFEAEVLTAENLEIKNIEGINGKKAETIKVQL